MARRRRRSHRSHWLINVLGVLAAVVLGLCLAGAAHGQVPPGMIALALVIIVVGVLLAR
jgi:undecaprenyl pyrophosphate phosphatase UppP